MWYILRNNAFSNDRKQMYFLLRKVSISQSTALFLSWKSDGDQIKAWEAQSIYQCVLERSWVPQLHGYINVSCMEIDLELKFYLMCFHITCISIVNENNKLFRACKVHVICKWNYDSYILITHDNCTCIFHDLSKLFSSAHEVYRFRRALPCFYLGKVTVTIIRSKRGGMFKMLLWDFWQRMGHELSNIHLGTDDSPCVDYVHANWNDHEYHSVIDSGHGYINVSRGVMFKLISVVWKSIKLKKFYLMCFHINGINNLFSCISIPGNYEHVLSNV